MPIACSLTPDDANDRFEEWRQFLSERVVEIERTDDSARFRLEESDDALLIASDLARREKTCCPFFDFRLLLTPDAVWFEIEAPREAAAVVSELIRMASVR
jgi:hypothetical protein